MPTTFWKVHTPIRTVSTLEGDGYFDVGDEEFVLKIRTNFFHSPSSFFFGELTNESIMHLMQRFDVQPESMYTRPHSISWCKTSSVFRIVPQFVQCHVSRKRCILLRFIS